MTWHYMHVSPSSCNLARIYPHCHSISLVLIVDLTIRQHILTYAICKLPRVVVSGSTSTLVSPTYCSQRHTSAQLPYGPCGPNRMATSRHTTSYTRKMYATLLVICGPLIALLDLSKTAMNPAFSMVQYGSLHLGTL